MDHQERQKIYALLARYYPNAKQLKDKTILTAWGLALERFAYADVKNAVIDYAIHNKFFPDLADITAGLTPEQPLSRPAAPVAGSSLAKQLECGQMYREMMRRELERRGLPAYTIATEGECVSLSDACKQAGIDTVALLNEACRIVYGVKEVSQ